MIHLLFVKLLIYLQINIYSFSVKCFSTMSFSYWVNHWAKLCHDTDTIFQKVHRLIFELGLKLYKENKKGASEHQGSNLDQQFPTNFLFEISYLTRQKSLFVRDFVKFFHNQISESKFAYWVIIILRINPRKEKSWLGFSFDFLRNAEEAKERKGIIQNDSMLSMSLMER